MKHLLPTVLLCLYAALLSGGCTMQVDYDYRQYLEDNYSQISYPNIAAVFGYSCSPKVYRREIKIHSLLGLPIYWWKVNMYTILSETFRTEDIQNIFIKLYRNDFEKNRIVIEDVAYEFKDFRVYINMRIRTLLNGKKIIVKEYHAQGEPQHWKMFIGKALAMKYAIQQSTKTAMDKIFLQYFTDLSEWWGEEIKER